MVQEHLPWDGPIEVVPHGVLEPVPTAQRARAPQPGERLRVGTFGTWCREGRARARRCGGGLDCELHLAGPFLDAGFERACARAPASSRCGSSATARTPRRPSGRGLHLAVFPSRCQETYGLVVDEALAHGVPVLCSDAARSASARRCRAWSSPPFPPCRGAARSRHRAAGTRAPARGDSRARCPRSRPRARYRELYERALARADDEALFCPLLPKDQLRPPVLALAAHPDDEVIGAGGLLAWHGLQGHPVTVVHMTDGAQGDPGSRAGDIPRRAPARRGGGAARLRLPPPRTGTCPTAGCPNGSSRSRRGCACCSRRCGRRRSTRSGSARHTATTARSRRRRAGRRRAAGGLPLPPVRRQPGAARRHAVRHHRRLPAQARACEAYASQLAYIDFAQLSEHRDRAATVNVDIAASPTPSSTPICARQLARAFALADPRAAAAEGRRVTRPRSAW